MSWWLSLAKTAAKQGARKAAKAERDWLSPKPATVPLKTALANLKHDRNLQRDYLESLIKRVQYRNGVKDIMTYLKSSAAENLTAKTKADLWLLCLEKLKIVDIMNHFM